MQTTPKSKSGSLHKSKGFLALAGEAFSVLGEEIVQGKDKVMEVASEKFTEVKKTVRKKFAHKKPADHTVKKKAAVAGKTVSKKVAAKRNAAKKNAAKKVANKHGSRQR